MKADREKEVIDLFLDILAMNTKFPVTLHCKFNIKDEKLYFLKREEI